MWRFCFVYDLPSPVFFDDLFLRCAKVFFEFYANINITPTFAADAIQCYRTKCEKIYNLWNIKCWISRMSFWHTNNNSQSLEIQLFPVCIAQCPLLFCKFCATTTLADDKMADKWKEGRGRPIVSSFFSYIWEDKSLHQW